MIDRIKQIMEYYQLAPASFAEQIGINRSNLTHLFSGRNQPSLDLAKKILHCFPEIKTEWLIMGVGGMMRGDEEKELNIRIQNEKNKIWEKGEPDLFSVEAPPSPLLYTVSEESVVKEKEITIPVSNSKRDIEKEKTASVVHTPLAEKEEALSHPFLPTITKIVFFYSDSRFEIFHPK